MNMTALHPNTQTLLSAWERMSAAPAREGVGPNSAQHPDIIDCLFVLERHDEDVWAFRSAGDRMAHLLGRELAGHDYLDFWTGHDRQMLTAFLMAVHESRLPGIVQASGETLTGERIDIEMTLAPMTSLKGSSQQVRLLGLYQTLRGTEILKRRPVWRHRLTAIFPPDIRGDEPHLRLITNSDD